MSTFRRLPGLNFISAVNAVAAVLLFGLIPFQTLPDRAVAYLVFGLLHGWLALGLFVGWNIARIVMIGATVFHVAGFLINTVVTLILLHESPFTPAIAGRLALNVGVIVFMAWAAFYLLAGLTRGWFNAGNDPAATGGDADAESSPRE
jgi:hypothetical protein